MLRLKKELVNTIIFRQNIHGFRTSLKNKNRSVILIIIMSGRCVVDILQALGAFAATNARRISNLYGKRIALLGQKPVNFRLIGEK